MRLPRASLLFWVRWSEEKSANKDPFQCFTANVGRVRGLPRLYRTWRPFASVLSRRRATLWPPQFVQRDLGCFFVFAAAYFVANATAVNAAIVLSSGRAFREVWNLNTRGVLAYDIGASVIAVLVAWLYTRFDHWLGFGSIGLIGVIVPIVAVRHVYGLYHQLEDSGQELLAGDGQGDRSS